MLYIIHDPKKGHDVVNMDISSKGGPEAMTSFEMVLRKLRIAGIFILISLIVEIISLVWNHPLSLMAFLIAGGLLLAAGTVTYLREQQAESK